MNGFPRVKIRKRRKVEKRKYLTSQGLIEIASGRRLETTVKIQDNRIDLKLNMEVKETKTSQ